MLGKRKRDTVILRRSQQNGEDVAAPGQPHGDTSEVFRKYFEAAFDPLPESNLTNPSISDVEDGSSVDGELLIGEREDDTESEWSGISGNDIATPLVEVVDYASSAQPLSDDPIGKIFQKAFMSSKPPRETQGISSKTPVTQATKLDEEEDTKNLKHDLDLQRLLQESHLLGQKKKIDENGAQRHRATDSRMQSLGSRTSVFAQTKMPMSHRRGITAKASSQAAQRHKEAKENGVILSQPSKKGPAAPSRRERGVDVPVVGKFKGGTLQLSRKDVASIQGPRRSGSKRGRR